MRCQLVSRGATLAAWLLCLGCGPLLGVDPDSLTAGGNASGSGGADASGGGSATVGGSGGTLAGSSNSAGTAGSAGTPVIVAVGDGARIVRSLDLGSTWVDDQVLPISGPDYEIEMRGVAFGNGVFVASGYHLFSSVDGATWVERKNPENQWLQGLVFAKGMFIACGGYGYTARSLDGLSWTITGVVPQNDASGSLAFGADQFVNAAPTGNWYSSSNGDSWVFLSGGHGTDQIAFCGGFHEPGDCSGPYTGRERVSAGGVTVRLNSGVVQHATDGETFQTVANAPGNLEAITVGFVE